MGKPSHIRLVVKARQNTTQHHSDLFKDHFAQDFLIFVVTNLALAGGLFAARATYSSRFRLPMAAAWCGVAILLAGFSQGLPPLD